MSNESQDDRAARTVYEPHPVTPERKAELRAQGKIIVDAVFAPADAEPAKPARRNAKE